MLVIMFSVTHLVYVIFISFRKSSFKNLTDHDYKSNSFSEQFSTQILYLKTRSHFSHAVPEQSGFAVIFYHLNMDWSDIIITYTVVFKIPENV